MRVHVSEKFFRMEMDGVTEPVTFPREKKRDGKETGASGSKSCIKADIPGLIGSLSISVINGDTVKAAAAAMKFLAVLVATVSVCLAAPSAIWSPVLGGVGVIGPQVGPAVVTGAATGPVKVAGAIAGPALITGSVAGPSAVVGSAAGPTIVSEPGLGSVVVGNALVAPALAGHALVAGPATSAVVAGPVTKTTVIGASSSAIVAGGHAW